jgi:transcriptional regulator with XRE-family HTH domain
MRPEEIKAKRLQLGLTQAKLGAALGVSGGDVARWERGEAPPDAPAMLEAALDYLLLEKSLGGELKKRLVKLQKVRAKLERLVREPLLSSERSPKPRAGRSAER